MNAHLPAPFPKLLGFSPFELAQCKGITPVIIHCGIGTGLLSAHPPRLSLRPAAVS